VPATKAGEVVDLSLVLLKTPIAASTSKHNIAGTDDPQFDRTLHLGNWRLGDLQIAQGCARLVDDLPGYQVLRTCRVVRG
jgi:hypothetical protein